MKIKTKSMVVFSFFIGLLIVHQSYSQPIVTISSPLNQTYQKGTAQLNVSISEPANLTLMLNNETIVIGNVSLYQTYIYGKDTFNLTVFAENENGNSSDEVVFTLEENESNSVTVGSCGILGSMTTYYMNQSIIDYNGTCFYFATNYATLDCRAYMIDGVGSGSGVEINDHYSNSVKNCTIREFSNGIYIHEMGGNHNMVYQCIITGCGMGIYQDDGSDNKYFNNTIINNTIGIREYDTVGKNKIYNNFIVNNTNGLSYDNAGRRYRNDIYNNLFNNSVNVISNPAYPRSHNWNTTRKIGIRIYVPNGYSWNYIGGNYWGSPNGTGYSDTCLADGFGFCPPYTVISQGDNVDYLPLGGYNYLSITFNYSSVSFGVLEQGTTNNPAPNQENGTYNVTVDASDNYKILASGDNFTGGTYSFSISNLKIDVNETASNLSINSSKTLSSTQTIIEENISNTVTINYYGYWLSIPPYQFATSYNTTLNITYELV